MYYFVKITKPTGETYYVHSPVYKTYTLSSERPHAYLFASKERAEKATAHLVGSGDVMEVVRTYDCPIAKGG